MKGLEICESFYNEYGKKMLQDFASVLPFLAVGICGSGSECFGYDDEFSADHDYEAGFTVFLPDEETVDRKTAFELERAYAKLPKEFMGLRRSILAPVGGSRHGVKRISEFFTDKVYEPNGDLPLKAWLNIPENYLLEATNGKIFFDNYGLITKIREKLHYLPEDVRLKKLAGNLLLMAQAGQYNYARCLLHNETAASQLAVIEFVKSTVNVIFLLNKRYEPYYKWCFKALGELEKFSEYKDSLEYLLTSTNDEKTSLIKSEIIEDISKNIIFELKNQNLTEESGSDLEKHAYSVNKKISDNGLRNARIFEGV